MCLLINASTHIVNRFNHGLNKDHHELNLHLMRGEQMTCSGLKDQNLCIKDDAK